MNTATHYHFAGMGQTNPATGQHMSTAQTASYEAATGSAAAAQFMAGQYVQGAGSAIMMIAPLTGPAAPFVAIAGAAVELVGAIGIGKGCGQTCITATQFANQAEPLLRQNLATYQALPTPRYQSQQTAALNIFDQVWAALISPQVCGNPALGDAGKRCISDRQAGSCAYKGSNGACWNWFVGYRDPIANDTNVVPDTVASTVSSAISSVIPGGAGMDPMMLMLIAGVGLVVVMNL